MIFRQNVFLNVFMRSNGICIGHRSVSISSHNDDRQTGHHVSSIGGWNISLHTGGFGGKKLENHCRALHKHTDSRTIGNPENEASEGRIDGCHLMTLYAN